MSHLFLPDVFPVLFSFSSEWLCPRAVIPCRWEYTLDGSSETRPFRVLPSASLVYLFSLVAGAVRLCLSQSQLWTSVYHPSLMTTLCTSVNQLTSFQASWILASSLLLHGGLPLPASVILYPSASRITLTNMSSLLWESP